MLRLKLGLEFRTFDFNISELDMTTGWTVGMRVKNRLLASTSIPSWRGLFSSSPNMFWISVNTSYPEKDTQVIRGTTSRGSKISASWKIRSAEYRSKPKNNGRGLPLSIWRLLNFPKGISDMFISNSIIAALHRCKDTASEVGIKFVPVTTVGTCHQASFSNKEWNTSLFSGTKCFKWFRWFIKSEQIEILVSLKVK